MDYGVEKRMYRVMFGFYDASIWNDPWNDAWEMHGTMYGWMKTSHSRVLHSVEADLLTSQVSTEAVPFHRTTSNMG
jgi:hypothetical protein